MGDARAASLSTGSTARQTRPATSILPPGLPLPAMADMSRPSRAANSPPLRYPPPGSNHALAYSSTAFPGAPSYMYGFPPGPSYSGAAPPVGPSYPGSSHPSSAPTSTFDPTAGPSSQQQRANGPAKPKKRKSAGLEPERASSQGLAEGTTPESPDDDGRKEKRSKTPRACDQCRRKKIRCDIIADTSPPLCVHCQAHRLDCTYFLPISETRFKKRKGDEDDSTSNSPDHASHFHRPPVHAVAAPPPMPQAPQYANGAPSVYPPSTGVMAPPLPGEISRQSPTVPEARMLGPTSISHIMHSMSTFPIDRIDAYDSRNHVAWDVRESGDGFIHVHPPEQPPRGAGHLANSQLDMLPPHLVEQLVNRYFEYHAPVFPMITKRDFLNSRECMPLLIEVMCGLSAASHEVPPEILRIIKNNIMLISRDDDILGRSSLQTVQALLIFSFTLELERNMPGSKVWNMLGAAIRMAYDLGLHREYHGAQDRPQVDTSELRRRVWAGLVIADRWLAAMYGLPMGIDLADCDRLFPSNHDLLPGSTQPDLDPRDQPYLAYNKLLELSIILGRILKLMYTPTGIMGLTDAKALEMEASMNEWQAKLPEHLKHDSPGCAPAAGYLNLCLVPVLFLFARPFMRISFTCEALTYSFGMANWDNMAGRAAAAIEWADTHSFCIESWAPGLYGLFISSLLQYHIFVRKREDDSLVLLKKAADTLTRARHEECIARKKTTELVCLLYNTAMSIKTMRTDNNNSQPEGTRRGMNPTHGVRMRPKEPVVRWDPATKTYMSEAGAVAEPATSYTAAGGASSAATTPITASTPTNSYNNVSDLRSTSTTSSVPSATVPAPIDTRVSAAGSIGPPVVAQLGMPPDAWRRGGEPNVNPNLNLPDDIGQHVLEPSLDFLNFGAMPSDVPPFDAAYFPDSLLDMDSWTSFFDSTPSGTSTSGYDLGGSR